MGPWGNSTHIHTQTQSAIHTSSTACTRWARRAGESGQPWIGPAQRQSEQGSAFEHAARASTGGTIQRKQNPTTVGKAYPAALYRSTTGARAHRHGVCKRLRATESPWARLGVHWNKGHHQGPVRLSTHEERSGGAALPGHGRHRCRARGTDTDHNRLYIQHHHHLHPSFPHPPQATSQPRRPHHPTRLPNTRATNTVRGEEGGNRGVGQQAAAPHRGRTGTTARKS